MTTPLLEIDNLAVSFPTASSQGATRVQAVRGVSLQLHRRQTLAIVGESGCGKSVTCLSILRLVPTPPARYESGRIMWYGSADHHAADTPTSGNTAPVDLLQLSESNMQRIRGGQIAMIFQEPMTSLNPVYTIGEQILEAILLHQKVDRATAVNIAVEALRDVGIADPANRLREYPHQLSGGMRQRIMIAMALACQPQLLLADEPTTALDVTIQAQILDLLRSLQEKRSLSVLLVTHDLGVVAQNADMVAVMYAGKVVEFGSVHDVFQQPLHPYTQGLFASMPVLGKEQSRLTVIPGNVPNPAEFPPGCAFHTRCNQVNGDEKCMTQVPPLREIRPGHFASCLHV